MNLTGEKLVQILLSIIVLNIFLEALEIKIDHPKLSFAIVLLLQFSLRLVFFGLSICLVICLDNLIQKRLVVNDKVLVGMINGGHRPINKALRVQLYWSRLAFGRLITCSSYNSDLPGQADLVSHGLVLIIKVRGDIIFLSNAFWLLFIFLLINLKL